MDFIVGNIDFYKGKRNYSNFMVVCWILEIYNRSLLCYDLFTVREKGLRENWLPEPKYKSIVYTVNLIKICKPYIVQLITIK